MILLENGRDWRWAVRPVGVVAPGGTLVGRPASKIRLCESGSTVFNGKEPHHKGHKVHKGVKSLDCSRFSFVTVVSFVFEKGFPLITGDRADLMEIQIGSMEGR
jgi:hypothetical protein